MTISTTAKKRPTLAARLKRLGACSDAVEWARGYKSDAKAWRECERGDWMLWIAGRLSGKPDSEGRKKLVLCACECARLSLPIFETKSPKDDRVRKCIETAERWARGEATIDELRKARDAADAAAAAATYAAATYAAAAAAAAYAADAAAAAAAATYAADAAARTRVWKACADIVRRHYPKPPKYSATKRGDER